MNKQEQVTLTELFHRLYGHGGFKGDIPEIKEFMDKAATHFDDHSKRLTIAETQIKERTANKTSKKAIAGYSSGGVLLLALTALQIIQALA